MGEERCLCSWYKIGCFPQWWYHNDSISDFIISRPESIAIHLIDSHISKFNYFYKLFCFFFLNSLSEISSLFPFAWWVIPVECWPFSGSSTQGCSLQYPSPTTSHQKDLFGRICKFRGIPSSPKRSSSFIPGIETVLFLVPGWDVVLTHQNSYWWLCQVWVQSPFEPCTNNPFSIIQWQRILFLFTPSM